MSGIQNVKVEFAQRNGARGRFVNAHTVNVPEVVFRTRTALREPCQGRPCSQVPSHRVVLASWSDVFRVLLGRWVADRGEHPTILVRLVVPAPLSPGKA